MPVPIQDAHDSRPVPVKPDEKKSSFWLAVEAYVERLFITFSLYTLSIGPLYWWWVDAREAKGSLWIAAFYEPLRRLGQHFPAFGEWLNWYVSLWIL